MLWADDGHSAQASMYPHGRELYATVWWINGIAQMGNVSHDEYAQLRTIDTVNTYGPMRTEVI